MVINLAVCFSAGLALLAWIGWRFFIVPSSSRINRTSEDTVGLTPHISTIQTPAQKTNEKRLAHFIHWPLWLALLLAGLTVMAVLGMSGHISLDPLQALDFHRQQHIQVALNPEKLVPPPVLPPSLFITAERPALATADRDWNRLSPGFMQQVLRVFARMEARGYPFALLEGYRSPERQDMLAGLGNHVTNARAFQSKHQYGLALDAAPLRDGKLVISERDQWAMQAYQALGEEAEKAGLVWGGRWKLKDYGHVEAAAPISASLKKK
jgi:peptidoglycan L-alanyl-D-glutamate endopeptidase CwlK